MNFEYLDVNIWVTIQAYPSIQKGDPVGGGTEKCLFCAIFEDNPVKQTFDNEQYFCLIFHFLPPCGILYGLCFSRFHEPNALSALLNSWILEDWKKKALDDLLKQTDNKYAV